MRKPGYRCGATVLFLAAQNPVHLAKDTRISACEAHSYRSNSAGQISMCTQIRRLVTQDGPPDQ